MVDPQTSNLQLFQPIRGSDVGTWDVPVNANTGILDLAVGGVATITLNNTPVVLASSQYEAKTLIFSSTLTGNVPITFPTSFIKSWEIYNTCTGSSAFVVTLTTGSGQVVAAPPGETIEIFSDGANLRYKNFGRVGSYWDYAGSSVPAWVSACSLPPYLLCSGGTFSSASYPQLATILGSTTLPDFRGRQSVFLNSGTGRLTSSGAGINADTIFNTGGGNGVTLASSQIPSITVNTVSGHLIPTTADAAAIGSLPVSPAGGATYAPYTSNVTGWLSVTSLTYTNSSQAVVQNAIPSVVGGIRMIRAA